VRISRSPRSPSAERSAYAEKLGLTQEALADAADLDATFIRGLERGIANPTWDAADRIARALGSPYTNSPAQPMSWRPATADQPAGRYGASIDSETMDRSET
jgi:transcriptional regulator with XRE-family HTH domain